MMMLSFYFSCSCGLFSRCLFCWFVSCRGVGYLHCSLVVVLLVSFRCRVVSILVFRSCCLGVFWVVG